MALFQNMGYNECHKFINYLRWTNTFPSLASFACGIRNIVYNFYYTSINIYFTTIVIVYKLVISIFSRYDNTSSHGSYHESASFRITSGAWEVECGWIRCVCKQLCGLWAVEHDMDATDIRRIIDKARELNEAFESPHWWEALKWFLFILRTTSSHWLQNRIGITWTQNRYSFEKSSTVESSSTLKIF